MEKHFENSRSVVDGSRAGWQLGGMDVVDAAARLEALGNPTRLAIFRMLVRAGDGGMLVGVIQERLGIAASTLSHHLKTLLIVDLITQEREGRTLICRANYPAMRGLVDFLVAECCTDSPATALEGSTTPMH